MRHGSDDDRGTAKSRIPARQRQHRRDETPPRRGETLRGRGKRLWLRVGPFVVWCHAHPSTLDHEWAENAGRSILLIDVAHCWVTRNKFYFGPKIPVPLRHRTATSLEEKQSLGEDTHYVNNSAPRFRWRYHPPRPIRIAAKDYLNPSASFADS